MKNAVPQPRNPPPAARLARRPTLGAGDFDDDAKTRVADTPSPIPIRRPSLVRLVSAHDIDEDAHTTALASQRAGVMPPPVPALTNRLPGTTSPTLPGTRAVVVAPPQRRVPQKSMRLNAVEANKLVVSAYKAIGFAVLTAILVGLASYLIVNVYYLFSTAWIQPTIVSPTDEKILALSTQLAQQSSSREKLFADRATIAATLEDTSRVIAVQEGFQESFKSAVKADLAARQTELHKLSRLTRDYQHARSEIVRSSRLYAGLTRERSKEMHAAKLIGDDGLINGNYQAAQIANSNLALAEKAVDIDTRKAELEREATALNDTIANLSPKDLRGAAGQLSYDVLRIKQEFMKSVLEAQKARDTREALKKSVAAMDNALGRYDRILKSLQESPYLLAAEHNATIAFVPYDNLSAVAPGVSLYGCSLGLVWCHEVGKVVRTFPGEVSVKHPIHSSMLRGVMVQIELKDPGAAQNKVLFARSRPFLL